MEKAQEVKNLITTILTGNNAFLQVPLHHQKAILGLDKKTLAFLRGGRGFDIGCGKGALVEHLREKEIDFEGIDPDVDQDSNKPYLIKQKVCGVYPMSGSIPRPNDSYDLVVAFQVYSLNRGFTLGGVLRDPRSLGMNEENIQLHDNLITHAQYIILEGTRILKPGQRFVIYPKLTRLEEVMGFTLDHERIRVSSEPVNKTTAKNYLAWEKNELGFPNLSAAPEVFCTAFGLYERTVLTKVK